MGAKNRYPEYILRILRQRSDLEENDPKLDERFQSMPSSQVFTEVLEWNGLLGGWEYRIKHWIKDIYGVDIEAEATQRIQPEEPDCFYEIANRLRDYSDGDIWSTGDELLCKTESAANMLADLIEQLYRSYGEDIVVNTGHYDPEDDKRNNEEDRFTGWWYVNIG